MLQNVLSAAFATQHISHLTQRSDLDALVRVLQLYAEPADAGVDGAGTLIERLDARHCRVKRRTFHDLPDVLRKLTQNREFGFGQFGTGIAQRVKNRAAR